MVKKIIDKMEDYPEIMEYLISIPNMKLNFKNEEELRSLISNVRYITFYIQENIKNHIHQVIEVYFEAKDIVNIQTSTESFQLHIMNKKEIIEFMIENFDNFFNLSLFTPSFLHSYFSNEKYSKICIPSTHFAEKLMQHFCDDYDLHLMLKSGICDINHFVQHLIDIDGINHLLNCWNEQYYVHDVIHNIFILRFDV